MAKLKGLKGNIENIQKRLAGGAADNSLAAFAQGQQVLTGAVINLKQQIEVDQANIKKLVDGLQEHGKIFGANSAEINKLLGMVSQLARIEKDLAGVPRVFPVPKDIIIPDNAEQFAGVMEELKTIPRDFPKTDLQETRDLLLAILEKVNVPPVTRSIFQSTKQKTKWTFVIKRDDEGFIEQVVVS